MNKNLYALTIEKLKFEHICDDLEASQIIEQLPVEQVKELTAFEKFKLTPAYKQILLKAGKDPNAINTDSNNANPA